MTLAHTRLEALKKLLLEGSGGTQERISRALLRKKFSVTKSTISRDLRRLGAIRVNTPEGKLFIVYHKNNWAYRFRIPMAYEIY